MESFKKELENITTESVELASWRKRGPIGKLHNLIKYICYSTQRRDAFKKIQEDAAAPLQTKHRRSDDLIHDNLTRWNSWYDAAVRALDLRPAIDDFVDAELSDYDIAVVRFNNSRGSQTKPAPKKPSLADDRLTADDWHVITQYVEILKPCKDATMMLQGQVNASTGKGTVKGAIWQVLPIYEQIMASFEAARERYKPAESQSQLSQRTLVASLPSQAPSKSRRTTRRLQPTSSATLHANTENEETSNTRDLASEQTDQVYSRELPLSFKHHFSTNINLGW